MTIATTTVPASELVVGDVLVLSDGSAWELASVERHQRYVGTRRVNVGFDEWALPDQAMTIKARPAPPGQTEG